MLIKIVQSIVTHTQLVIYFRGYTLKIVVYILNRLLGEVWTIKIWSLREVSLIHIVPRIKSARLGQEEKSHFYWLFLKLPRAMRL